jgi:CDI immunity protein
MNTRRQPLKFCDDWEPMFPVQALFNAISDDCLVDVVRHFLNRHGYSSDYCHCHFPADLDPDEPSFQGVLFSHFDDMILITKARFADVLDRVLVSYKAVAPVGASTLSMLLTEFRRLISDSQ